ncbi:hypothetical protein Pla123a_06570 [Posidoniimonas polymericola]|uniref:PEP-CTERM protein-sorting domain-containing protein n=1 Tax=Posidoniimonas polymericola TaxID=2528002 RepID=A0A5C5ZFH6_9BACT|nr:PEP-CTERM sorting domain-containing protein [Posidoniimonas polymericola]TWT85850.1 hypothetical protein Pla123a_06570 [Posidoniimonas polymericola]
MKGLIAAFVVFTWATQALALSVFLSSSATDPGAVDPLIMPLNSTADLYVWIRPDAGTQITTAAMDIGTSYGWALEVAGFEIETPDVLGTSVWQGGVQDGVVDGYWRLVDDSVALAGGGVGIDASLIGSGQDPREFDGAFLHGVLSVQSSNWSVQSNVYPATAGLPFVVDGAEVLQFQRDGLTVCTGACVAPPLLGDTNLDGVFNTIDIDPFVQTLTAPAVWKAAHPGVPMEAVADMNEDGVVNTLDIAKWTEGFVYGESPVATSSAPEPATIALSALAIAGAACLCRRRSHSRHR